jgi:segregation and condensation protein A
LNRAFAAVLVRAEEGEQTATLETEEIQIELMIRGIIRRALLRPEGLPFVRLFAYRSRLEIIIAFVAVLELLRGGLLRARASENADDIFIIPTAKAREYADLPEKAL